MDTKDKKIIRALERDGRAKLSKISKEIELPPTTTFNRIKKLEGAGIIEPTIKLDVKKLGYGIEFFIMIKLDTSRKGIDQEVLAKKLLMIKNIREVSVVTGGIDLIAKAVTKDIDELSELVLKKIRGFDGVVSSETIVVMKDFRGRDSKLLD